MECLMTSGHAHLQSAYYLLHTVRNIALKIASSNDISSNDSKSDKHHNDCHSNDYAQ